MSKFSDMLNDLVHDRNTRMASLALHLGTDRANLYKLLNGTRIPGSRVTVEKIADFMALTPSEREQLLEYYHMEEIGEDIYYQRKSALRFLTNDFYLQSVGTIPSDQIFPGNGQLSAIEQLPEVLTLQGTQQIQQMLSLICRHAVDHQGTIRVVAQPTWAYLSSLLQALGHLHTNLSIEHILCLNTGSAPADYEKSTYNMLCIEKIMPLYSYNCQYHPYFYYDNIDSHYNNLQLFSYAVITEEYVLTCSSDIQQGLLFHDPAVVRLYKDQFERKLSLTTPLFHVLQTDVSEYMQITLDSIGVSLDATPCFLLLIPQESLQELLCPGEEPSPFYYQLLDYLTELQRRQSEVPSLLLNFSDAGLNHFMETGRIANYPEEIYPQIPEYMRLQLLALLRDLPDEQLPRRLKPPLSQIPPVSCMVMNERTGYFLVKKYDGQLTYLSLQEQTMRQTLYDFICHMDEEGYLYSAQETRNYLQEVLEDYQQRLGIFNLPDDPAAQTSAELSEENAQQ